MSNKEQQLISGGKLKMNTKPTEEQKETLDNLEIALMTNLCQNFSRIVSNMQGAFLENEKGKLWIDYFNVALKHIDKIEDAIKRFRENRPQQFEEK